jgi:outer membrane translocation and assembly module TamA
LKKVKLTYYLPFYLLFLLASCSQTKYLSKNEYLLTKNEVQIQGDAINKTEIERIIRQKPNTKILGIPFSLIIYNQIDSSKILCATQEHLNKLHRINHEKLTKQKRINDKRIQKAIRKGKTEYKERIVDLRDTINPRTTLREWLKFKIGEQPSILDSLYFNKSIEQTTLYLRKKGYYDAKVRGELRYAKKSNKVKALYVIETGKVFLIDSMLIDCDNKDIQRIIANFPGKQTFKNHIFDADKLEEYRESLGEYIKNEGMYGFSSSNISYVADTLNLRNKVNVTLQISGRVSKNSRGDSLITTPHQYTYINNVYFHIVDTSYVSYRFADNLKAQGLSLEYNNFLRTLDTLVFTNEEVIKGVQAANMDSLRKKRTIILTYNGGLSVYPDLLEIKNVTENSKIYTENLVIKTQRNLIELGLFNLVKPEIIEIEGTNKVEVHYYLQLKKKNQFSTPVKLTTSGTYFGASFAPSFTNINLLKRAEKITLNISGGLQSMPNLKYQAISSSANTNANGNLKEALRFWTFQIIPSLKVEIPYFLGLRNKISKQNRPKTTISSSYMYQIRDVFTKQSLNANVLFSVSTGDNSDFSFGFPGISSVNLINFTQISSSFVDSIKKRNDLYTLNQYTSQINWSDFKFVFQVYNKRLLSGNYSFKSSFDLAGNLLSLFGRFEKANLLKQRTILGIPYSQFARIDNEFVYAHKFTKYSSIHFRALAGGGLPYGNSLYAMPFDFSFIGGGANDIRGWRYGSLTPGSYNSYLVSKLNKPQIGDVRINLSGEYRFKMTTKLRGALFVDAGNIWTVKYDSLRPGSQINKEWFKELAVASGFGIRYDIDFVVIRLDVGLKLRNPALQEGHRWFFQPKDEQVYKIISEHPDNYSSPFLPRSLSEFVNTIRLGIGYPF